MAPNPSFCRKDGPIAAVVAPKQAPASTIGTEAGPAVVIDTLQSLTSGTHDSQKGVEGSDPAKLL